MRFEEATEQTVTLVNNVINTNFRELAGMNLEIVFDLKKRKSGGNFGFQKIQKASELMKYLTMDNISEGIDVLLILDKLVFEHASDEDKKRIINKALLHIVYNPEKASPYNVKKFENDDFLIEQEMNNDIHWESRILTMAESLYSEED